MPLTTAQQVRLRISDRWRYGEETRNGDGLTQTFKLAQGAPFSSLVSASGYVPVNSSWSGLTTTVDADLGLLTFPAAISANSAWRATYLWAVFSDAEVDQFIANGGDVAGASLEAVKSLMFDSLRRAKWAAPDGSEYDDTAAMAQLRKLYEQIFEEQRQAPEGGIESWGDEQANYS